MDEQTSFPLEVIKSTAAKCELDLYYNDCVLSCVFFYVAPL